MVYDVSSVFVAITKIMIVFKTRSHTFNLRFAYFKCFARKGTSFYCKCVPELLRSVLIMYTKPFKQLCSLKNIKTYSIQELYITT